MKLVLASRSPRRRALLQLLGLPFEVTAADVNEDQLAGEAPAEYARRLSQHKAEAVARQHPASLVLAADTIVVQGNTVLGKPGNAAEAAATLRSLRGRLHEVYTAVTLKPPGDVPAVTELARSPVMMRHYTDAEIAAYIKSGDPFDKAGAYGIQNRDFHPVEAFDHCFANVMGLPLCHITRALRQMGLEPPADVPAACQHALEYDCPVYQRILAGGE